MSEFSRIVRLDSLGSGARAMTIAADDAERAALARRFGLIAIARLEADAEIVREGDVVKAEGRLRAAVTQSCVACAEPVPAMIDEAFSLRFVPPENFEADADEIELSEADCDVIPYDDGAIDLGEAVAETMALALPPFPRSPDADAILKAAGVLSEEDAGPFAALKGLRDRLSGS